MTGTTHGPTLVQEAKPHHQGRRQRGATEITHMDDTDRLLVESCCGNCLRLLRSELFKSNFPLLFIIIFFFLLSRDVYWLYQNARRE